MLTFQLHICQPDCRAETMSVETDLTAVRGSCNSDLGPWPASTAAPSVVVLANTQGSAALEDTSILETLASLGDSTNLKVSDTLEVFSFNSFSFNSFSFSFNSFNSNSFSFNSFFLESVHSAMVDLALCFQKT